ncbi:hypothetical protein INR49_026897 [Caranx melampygus]|nr:hypothetical protein INR49_026897 [Caranx melampygus]
MATGKHKAESQIQIKIDCDLDGIVIPFFSLLIKDIYFLNEGCANRLQNGHVNFEKFWELAKQVSEFMTWKKVECPFEKDRKILQYLLTAPVFTEDGRLWSTSKSRVTGSGSYQRLITETQEGQFSPTETDQSAANASYPHGDTLYLASYESEGPENNMEKDRWKSLSRRPRELTQGYLLCLNFNFTQTESVSFSSVPPETRSSRSHVFTRTRHTSGEGFRSFSGVKSHKEEKTKDKML